MLKLSEIKKRYPGKSIVSIFHAAAEYGDIRTITELLQAKVNCNMQSEAGHTALSLAAYYNKPQIVTKLLQEKAALDITGKFGETALYLAAQLGHSAIVTQLLEAGANINAPHINGTTPLMIAARNGREKAIELLSDAKASTGQANKEGITALLFAIQFNPKNESLITLLLDRKADPRLKPKEGPSALLIAEMRCSSTIVAKLTRAIEDFNLVPSRAKEQLDAKATPAAPLAAPPSSKDLAINLLRAAGNGRDIEVAQLLELRADPNIIVDDDANTPLALAAGEGHHEIVEKLVIAKALTKTTNSEGNSPLALAACEDHEDIVATLLAAKADPTEDSDHNTPLTWAATYGFKGIVKKLLDAKADPRVKDKVGKRPLAYATENGYNDIADLLRTAAEKFKKREQTKRRRVKENITEQAATASTETSTVKQDQDSKQSRAVSSETMTASSSDSQLVEKETSPLAAPAEKPAVDKLDQSIFHLADTQPLPSIDSEKLWSSLYDAAEQGDLGTVKTLLPSLQSNIDAYKLQGPLLVAAQNGHAPVIDLLLPAKANPNLPRAEDNVTPLFMAAAHGHKQAVVLLLEKKAEMLGRKAENHLSKENDGATPLHMAVKGGHTATALFLLEKNAEPNCMIKPYNIAPLHTAVNLGNIEIVQALLKARAKVDQPGTDYHVTPLTMAQNNGHTQIAALLEAASATTRSSRVRSLAPSAHDSGSTKSKSSVMLAPHASFSHSALTTTVRSTNQANQSTDGWQTVNRR